MSVTTDPLGDDPFDDDLTEQLRRRASRPPTRVTLALGGAVLAMAGFLGGVMVEKGHAASSSSAGGNSPFANFTGFPGRGGGGAGATGGPGAGTGQGGAGSTITGTVKFVDGTTVYITTSAGETITVQTNASTAIRSDQTIKASDLTVGATVTVRGTTDSNGDMTATQVTAQK
jgi:hypothetical protein